MKRFRLRGPQIPGWDPRHSSDSTAPTRSTTDREIFAIKIKKRSTWGACEAGRTVKENTFRNTFGSLPRNVLPLRGAGECNIGRSGQGEIRVFCRCQGAVSWI